ncbi:MAG: hypothetical protein WBA36_05660 [Mesorhizobium sp.]
MIILLTTRGNGYTLKSWIKGTFGVPTPKFRTKSYDSLFGAFHVRRATYIFGDLERLAPWELRIAADLFKAMKDAGLRCLNDPARAKCRVELSEALHAAGINPFRLMRADARPRPERFPVFLRNEDDHAKADATLYHNQDELDVALEQLPDRHVPLRGMLVSEVAAEPYSDGLWVKWGTWRIGDRIIVEHIAADDTWLVKVGDHAKVTEAAANDENDAVVTNRYADELRTAFELADIEFGRADHATLEGRQTVFEINTNPYIGAFTPGKLSLRRRTSLAARASIADALRTIDTEESGWLRIAATRIRRPIRWWRPGFVTPRRK